MDRKDLLSVTEVARFFNTGRYTIINWIQQGKLSAVKEGDKIVGISRKAVARFVMVYGKGEDENGNTD